MGPKTMTVRELIARLSTMPPEIEVLACTGDDDGEGSLDNLQSNPIYDVGEGPLVQPECITKTCAIWFKS